MAPVAKRDNGQHRVKYRTFPEEERLRLGIGVR
jgi:hypothetical protein